MTPPPIAHHLGALPSIGAAAVGMGVFDGVHLGHRALLDGVRSAAAAAGVKPVALVFDPPPREVLGVGTPVARLDELGEVIRRIEAVGVQPVVVAFDREVRSLEPDVFLAALTPSLELVELVMTPASVFGHRRAGTLERAEEIGRERRFGVRSIPLLEVDGAPVSSSRARAAVQAGDLAAAERLLGRPHSLTGDLALRDGGKVLSLGYVAALPPDGRYATRVTSAGAVERAEEDATLEIRLGGTRLELRDAPATEPGGPLRVALVRSEAQ